MLFDFYSLYVSKGRKFFTEAVNYRIYRSFSKSVITEDRKSVV